MKSPITGKEMVTIFENRKLVYRNETYTYVAQLLLCTDTGEKFTTTEMDEINMSQIYNQYREKYGIPFSEAFNLKAVE